MKKEGKSAKTLKTKKIIDKKLLKEFAAKIKELVKDQEEKQPIEEKELELEEIIQPEIQMPLTPASIAQQVPIRPVENLENLRTPGIPTTEKKEPAPDYVSNIKYETKEFTEMETRPTQRLNPIQQQQTFFTQQTTDFARTQLQRPQEISRENPEVTKYEIKRQEELKEKEPWEKTKKYKPTIA